MPIKHPYKFHGVWISKFGQIHACGSHFVRRWQCPSRPKGAVTNPDALPPPCPALLVSSPHWDCAGRHSKCPERAGLSVQPEGAASTVSCGLPLQLSMFYNYTGLTLYYYYRLSAHTNMTLWWQDYWTSSTSTSCLSLMWMAIVSAGLRYCRLFCWSYYMYIFERKLFLEGKLILHIHFIAFFGLLAKNKAKKGSWKLVFFHL